MHDADQLRRGDRWVAGRGKGWSGGPKDGETRKGSHNKGFSRGTHDISFDYVRTTAN